MVGYLQLVFNGGGPEQPQVVLDEHGGLLQLALAVLYRDTGLVVRVGPVLQCREERYVVYV